MDTHGNRPRNNLEKCAPIVRTIGTSDQGDALGATPLDGVSDANQSPSPFCFLSYGMGIEAQRSILADLDVKSCEVAQVMGLLGTHR